MYMTIYLIIFSPQYSQAIIADPSSPFGQADSSFYLTDVGCTGTENDILACDSTVATPGQCDVQFEPAVVTCFDDFSSLESRKLF